MRIIRSVGVVLAVLVGLPAVIGIAARLSDGPIAIFPGGPLEKGELVSGPESDWSFARDISEMEFQLVDPPRSRTIWLLTHGGRLFIVSGYMKTAVGRWWKQWPAQAERDGRALIRLEGKRYERQAVRIHDSAIIEALAPETRRKYGEPLTAEAVEAGEAWVFELVPRSSSSAPG